MAKSKSQKKMPTDDEMIRPGKPGKFPPKKDKKKK